MVIAPNQMELVFPWDRRQDGPGLSYQSPGLFLYPGGGGPGGPELLPPDCTVPVVSGRKRWYNAAKAKFRMEVPYGRP